MLDLTYHVIRPGEKETPHLRHLRRFWRPCLAHRCQVRCQVGDLKGMWHIVTPPNWFLTDVFFGCNLWCKPQDWMTKKLVGYLVGSCSDHVRIFGWVLMISQNQQKEQSIKSGKSQPFTVQHISSKDFATSSPVILARQGKVWPRTSRRWTAISCRSVRIKSSLQTSEEWCGGIQVNQPGDITAWYPDGTRMVP